AEDTAAEDAEQAAGVQFVQQAEGVAAADVDGLGRGDGGDRVGAAVDALEAIARVEAALAQALDVAVVVAQGVGDEEDPLDGAEERPHLSGEECDPLGGAEAAAAQEYPHFAPPSAVSVALVG